MISHNLDNLIDVNDLFLKNMKVDKNNVKIFQFTALNVNYYVVKWLNIVFHGINDYI